MKLKLGGFCLVLSLVLSLVLAGCGGGGGGGGTSQDIDLSSLISSKTVYFENVSDGTETFTGTATFNADGTYTETGTGSLSGAYVDNGTWTVSGNQLIINVDSSQRVHTYISSDSSGIQFEVDGSRYTVYYSPVGSRVSNVAGRWSVTETTGSNTCGEPTGLSYSYDVDVTATGNSLSVSTPVGTFSGTINGNVVSCGGSYPEDGGTTTINPLKVNVSSDESSFSGNSSWSWSDGSVSCSGTSSVLGIVNVDNVSAAIPGEPTLISNFATFNETNHNFCRSDTQNLQFRHSIHQ